MPRSNRPRRAGRTSGHDQEELDLQRSLYGIPRVESRRGGEWNVQRVSAASAAKSYVCPGCSLEVPPGQSHIVAWRADGIMGESADVAARRHWHSHCWKVN